MSSHRAPTLFVMMAFSDLCIPATRDAYHLQGREMTGKQSGLPPPELTRRAF
ncbi:hypothetical protein ACQFN5_13655 [Klebsiella sp. WOUb02]|uniref:hypothetical protein n=1 Tax=Klebsiella sp. WOUb02 TaxID=3161071 RepID=UPI003CF0CB60